MTIGSILLFDATLAFMLVAVAIGVLLARDLFQAIVLFIAFGLLLAVSWCRLEAVDVALAEVAIGAGLTGALLLNAWAATRSSNARTSESGLRKNAGGVQEERAAMQGSTPPAAGFPASVNALSSGVKAAILLVASLILAWGMAAVVARLAIAADAPRIAMVEALPYSGVEHPVTAVLLNFRAYDTLLEIVVLLAAVLAVTPLTSPSVGTGGGTPTGPVLGTFTRWMVPVTALVAVYVLWAGTKTPGGAFQAAAILCAAGVLLSVSGLQSPNWDRRRWRALLIAGLALFLLIGFIGMLGGGHFLQYPAGWAGVSIILIESALTVSLSLLLIRLFSSTSPPEHDPDGDGSSHQVSAIRPKEPNS